MSFKCIGPLAATKLVYKRNELFAVEGIQNIYGNGNSTINTRSLANTGNVHMGFANVLARIAWI